MQVPQSEDSTQDRLKEEPVEADEASINETGGEHTPSRSYGLSLRHFLRFIGPGLLMSVAYLVSWDLMRVFVLVPGRRSRSHASSSTLGRNLLLVAAHPPCRQSRP